MSRRSARFSTSATPLLELSLEKNEVQQQGLEEGWTLIENGSQVETFIREQDKWVKARVIGFAPVSTQSVFTKKDIRAQIKVVSSLQQEVYLSLPKAVAHYNSWVLLQLDAPSKSNTTLWRWVYYDKEHTVLRPLKKFSKKVSETPKPSAKTLRRTPRALKKGSEHSVDAVVDSSPVQVPTTTKKRKREKLEPIVFGNDMEILKKTCYTIKQNITRSLKISVHEVLDKLNLVYPEKIVRLIQYAKISQSDAFKLATRLTDNCSGTSLYCYVGYRDLQRTTVLEAGQKLSEWYLKYIKDTGKSLKDFEENCIPPPPPTPEPKIVKSTPSKNSVLQDGFETPKHKIRKLNTGLTDSKYRDTISKKLAEFEELDFTKWLHSRVAIPGDPPSFEVLLVLAARPTVTISLGKFKTVEISEKAGIYGAEEAFKYVEARKKGLNGANLAPSKVLRNDKKSILKNLKRVIPGRVAKKLGQALLPVSPKRTLSSRKKSAATIARTATPSLDKVVEGSATTMTLRKKRRLRPFEDGDGSLSRTRSNSEVSSEKHYAKDHQIVDYFKKRNRNTTRVSYGIQEKAKDTLVNWHSEGYICGERIYYSSFSFSDDPSVEYKLLDYVLVSRQERSEESSDIKLVFSIGQLEAIFLDNYDQKSLPCARVSWFYWQDETKLSKDYLKRFTVCNIPGSTEIYSSSDIEIQPLTSVVTKLQVLDVLAYVSKCRQTSLKTERMFNPKLQQPFSIPYTSTANQEDNLGLANGKDLQIRLKRKLIRNHFRDIVDNQFEMTVCCSHHYDSRLNIIIGHTHPKRDERRGEDPFLAPYLKLSLEKLDISSLFTRDDYRNAIRESSHAVVDLDLYNTTPVQRNKIIDEVSYFKEIQVMKDKFSNVEVKRCNFTSEILNNKPHVESMVNRGCFISLDCFFQRRQGLIRNSPGLIHRTSHAYRVILPTLDCSCPETGEYLLRSFLRNSGFQIEELTFVPLDIIRGPLPRVIRAASLRYLFGVRLVLKIPDKVKSPVFTVSSKYFGRTIEEGKGLACFEALSELLGIQTKFDIVPLLSGFPMRAKECMHLLQLIEKHGPSWDTCYRKLHVPGLDDIDIKEYFYHDVCPAFFATLERGEYWQLNINEQTYLRTKYEDKVLFPHASMKQTNMLISEAIIWAKDVKKFFLRRNRLFKSKPTRGITFAVVDKTTIFQDSKNYFAPLVTSNSEQWFNFHNKLSVLLKDFKQTRLHGIKNILLEYQDLITKPYKPNTSTDIATELEIPRFTKYGSAKQCEGCNQYFDMNSLSELPPQGTPSFCNQCLDDRSYLYDHTSWGKSGKILSRIADQKLLFSLDNLRNFMEFDFILEKENIEYDENVHHLLNKLKGGILLNEEDMDILIYFAKLKKFELPLIQNEWKDNDFILQQATKHAILDGWGKETPKPTSAVAKFSRPLGTSRGLDHEKLDTDVLLSVDWATRHFANEQINSLKLANKALAQALQEVTEQRNALLNLFLEKQS